MVTLIYTVVSLIIAFGLGIFGFFVGRCARKLPVIDNKLPWAIHRGQVPASAEPAREASSQGQRADYTWLPYGTYSVED